MFNRRAALSAFAFSAVSFALPAAVLAQNNDIETNKRLVVEFYNKAFNEGDIDGALTYLGDTYIQHNPMVPDGAAPLRAFLMSRKEKTPQARGHIKRVMAEKDLVMLHVNAVPAPGERGLAIVDIFRVENGKIVEHWDVIQPVPETARNSNTMF